LQAAIPGLKLSSQGGSKISHIFRKADSVFSGTDEACGVVASVWTKGRSNMIFYTRTKALRTG
jgi:hypothetical protein